MKTIPVIYCLAAVFILAPACRQAKSVPAATPAATTPQDTSGTTVPDPVDTAIAVIPDEHTETPVTQADPTTTDESEYVFGGLRFDTLVHYFGDILVSDGPQTCSFTFTNVGDTPAAVYEVVSSCGCTDVEWTREPRRPGEKGTITATFDNKAGPIPFDKTLTVWISDLKRPVVLHLRGSVHEKLEPLSVRYPVHAGPLGFAESELKAGNLRQGETVGDETLIANLSSSPVKVSFRSVSPGLSLSVSPNPVPAGATSVLRYSVTASNDLWGKNHYFADVLAGGSPTGLKLDVFAYTIANFDDMSEDEKSVAAIPMFEATNFNFGDVHRGETVEATYKFSNGGKRPFKAYRIDTDTKGATAQPLPEIPAGEKGTVRVTFDTSSAPSGECLVIISLTTNSPLRPIVNLFLSGKILD